jgi:hypothetical protein
MNDLPVRSSTPPLVARVHDHGGAHDCARHRRDDRDFSVVNAVLLRPLPFGEPTRLMQVAEKNDRLNLPNFGASVLNYLSWKERTRSFDRLGAFRFSTFNLSGRGDPGAVHRQCHDAVAAAAARDQRRGGRGFTDEEERPGAAPVAMISESLWRRRFNADPGAASGRPSPSTASPTPSSASRPARSPS